MKHIGWLLFVLYSSNALSAGEVEIPLLAETAHLQTAISRALEFDENGQSTISNDPCNRVELSDMMVVTEDAQLSVGMALTATTGAYVLGACRGPKPWQGRLALKLTPQVMASGQAIEFVPDSIILSRPDSSPGLLSKPVQLIADTLVLPRMKSVQIDLAGPLNSLDGLIEQMMGQGSDQIDEQSLIRRTHITRLQTEETGVRAWLAFQVRAPEPDDQAPEPSFDENEIAQWQTLEDELDGFLTTIISALAYSTESRALRLELLAVLLDARHAIAEALTVDDPEYDPVRELFLSTWDNLRPLMSELERLKTPGLDADFRLATFIAGGDALRALDALGPEYGFEITRDGLRRLARLLLAESAPPSFTPLPLEVDPEFRDLFGFNAKDEAVFRPAELTGQISSGFGRVGAWLLSVAHAESIPPAEALKGLVPRKDNLYNYLELVDSLLQEQASAWLAKNDDIPDMMAERLDPLVRATAWKESCWRHLVRSSDGPQVLRSAGGAVGMMQINGRVWRNVYDLDRLVDEVDYNVNAGIDILTHYMIDYAMRKGEHEQPGGEDNLVKATYAAYNGGPGHLSRYRREDTAASLQSIDNAFWNHYTTIKAEQWPDISSCYAVGG
ncbi:lytic transglycosylase domain-containing protein [Methylophaga sp. UBA2689]|uniref:lytic transglycosylase domain-containing protein n=1 Tax=Methylophaga sp. UBA2689 TaxID=1946878 RepID=UPI0025DBD6FB|nr:lytic transglycosylase domain-containing protein [Methylophaga sp. UBA2689]|tara:strand:+ start:11158 stop:13005 length:1848 start_codon:yes stop_codon:yes gene_type:complete